ncbi:MAG: hypothetical protein ACE15B_13780 [Bryobacteraceae bacterium]
MEIEGRGLELIEHRIGVEALGRPQDYSTGEDSTVRSQAHALRRKLDELYQKECPEAEVRIELGRGSYRPQFVRNVPAVQPVAVRPERRWPAPFRFRLPVFAGGLVLGSLLTAAFTAALVRWSPGTSGDIPRHMKDAWGALLNGGASAVICIGTPVNLWVRDLGETLPPYPANLLSMPGWPSVARYYEHTFGPQSLRKLYLQPHRNAVHFGDVAAAAVVVRALARAGVPVEILPERNLAGATTRNSDLILLGKPEFSPTMRSILKWGVLNIAVAGETGDYVIVQNRGDGAETVIATPKRDPARSEREEYGLITVMPGGGNGNGRRTVAFTGIGSGGWGAAEFFCSSRGLEDLNKSFRAEGRTRWPQAYQVLVRVTAKDGRPSAIRYVTHSVLDKDEPWLPAGQARRQTASYAWTVAKR